MTRASVVAPAVALGVAACGGIGAVKPWPAYATVSPNKPASPLHAPADQALVVTILYTPQGEGNGGYTVFDRDRTIVAQFTEPMQGWSVTRMAPGRRQFYLRTWTSDYCIRIDATLTAGKVYLLALSNDVKNARPDTATLAATAVDFNAGAHLPRAELVLPVAGTPAPGGPLLAYPFVVVDAQKARAVLAGHGSQVADCIHHADKAAPPGAPDAGFDEVDFTVPGG